MYIRKNEEKTGIDSALANKLIAFKTYSFINTKIMSAPLLHSFCPSLPCLAQIN